jgi:hypothetical protein
MDTEEKCFDRHFFEKGNARDGGGEVLRVRQGSVEVDQRDIGWK